MSFICIVPIKHILYQSFKTKSNNTNFMSLSSTKFVLKKTRKKIRFFHHLFFLWLYLLLLLKHKDQIFTHKFPYNSNCGQTFFFHFFQHKKDDFYYNPNFINNFVFLFCAEYFCKVSCNSD